MRKYLIINWNAIKELSIDEGKSLGWGYSINRDTKINSVKGNTCFKIELINGKKIIIGTQKGDEIKEFLEINKLEPYFGISTSIKL